MLTIILISVTLSACGSPSQEDVKESERFAGGSSISGARIITDNETGCKYLFIKTANAGGLSPLYDDKGEIICGK